MSTLWRLTALAAAARVLFLLLEPAAPPVADERTWADWARIVADRATFSPFRHKMIFHPPLYPYFLAGPYALFGTLDAARWIQAPLTALLVPAVGRVAGRTFGERAGLLAAGMAAFYPELVWFAAHFWVENLFLLLLFWGFERLQAADESGRVGVAAAAGLLWGLAVLARETALYFLPVAGAWLVWRPGRPRSGARAAAFLLAAAAVVAPWTYRNWKVFEAFVPVSTAGGQNLFQGNTHIPRDETYVMVDAVQGRIEQYRYARAMGLQAIRDRQPAWILEKLRDQMPNFWEAESMAVIHVKRGAYGRVPPLGAALVLAATVGPYLVVLAAFAVGLAALRPDRRAWLLLGFLGYYVLVHVVTHGFNRYRLPVMPVVFALASFAIVEAAGDRLAWTRPRRALAALLLVVAGLCVTPSFAAHARHCAFPWSAPREDAAAECPSR